MRVEARSERESHSNDSEPDAACSSNAPDSHHATIDSEFDRHIYMPDSPRRGAAVGAMFLSGLLFAVMGICTKVVGTSAAGRAVPPSEVMLFRCGFGLLVMLPLQGCRGIQLLGDDRRGLLLRGFSGAFAILAYFVSLQRTTLAHAVLLNYTSLIFAPVFAAFALQEKVNGKTGAAIAVAVMGILLVTQPRAGEFHDGDAWGLLSGILAGAAITAIRRLRQTETAWAVFFYLSLIGLPVAMLACLFQPPVVPTAAGWFWLGGMGISSVGAQILMTFGYKYVQAAEGGLITLSQILYAAGIGAVWFEEPLVPTTLGGGALILFAALWLTASPTRRGSVSGAWSGPRWMAGWQSKPISAQHSLTAWTSDVGDESACEPGTAALSQNACGLLDGRVETFRDEEARARLSDNERL